MQRAIDEGLAAEIAEHNESIVKSAVETQTILTSNDCDSNLVQVSFLVKSTSRLRIRLRGIEKKGSQTLLANTKMTSVGFRRYWIKPCIT